MKSYYRNKKILITGAASGIGRRFAERVHQIAGSELILWDLNVAELNAFRDQLTAKSGLKNVHVTGIDISDQERINLESEHLKKENLLPDIILNCAAVVTGSYFHLHSVQQIGNTIKINVLGSMWVVQAFISEMISRGSGQIVNMASASGYIGNPKMSVYESSK